MAPGARPNPAAVVDRARYPVLVALALLSVYGLELYLAGSVRDDAAYAFLTSRPPSDRPLVQVLAPFLHSSHAHVGWNLAWFLPIGTVLLGHVDPREFATVFLTVAWFTGAVAPWVLAGGPNFGISGANAALAGWAVLVVLRAMNESAAAAETPLEPGYWLVVAQLPVPAVLTVLMFGQSVGLVPVQPGASGFGHLFGVVFGLVYGLVWTERETGALRGAVR